MFSKEEITKWNNTYDTSKYPVSIYNELVVEQINNIRKFELMGAWKTGCLRVSGSGEEFIDNIGLSYEFTKRWRETTPVGYKVWRNISLNQEEYKNKIPDHFPTEEPRIVEELVSLKGFGFIWTLFVLHCYYPKIYPLYDQHVYRAYIHLISNGSKKIQLAPNTWSAYTEYKDFFANLIKNSEVSYWKLDRTLWAYGKKIKQGYQSKHKDESERTEKKEINNQINRVMGIWAYDYTLGGKKKEFQWRMDNYNLHIRRIIKDVYFDKIILEKELNLIQDYVIKDKWTDLANNVEKLKRGDEKDGLGKFLYKELSWSITDSQLASHIGAIFTHSMVWRDNGKKRGIQFARQNDNWKDRLRNYYCSIKS